MWEYLKQLSLHGKQIHLATRASYLKVLPDGKTKIYFFEAIVTGNKQIADLYKNSVNIQTSYPYQYSIGPLPAEKETDLAHLLGHFAENLFGHNLPGLDEKLKGIDLHKLRITPGKKAVDVLKVQISEQNSITGDLVVSKYVLGESKQKLTSKNIFEFGNMVKKIQNIKVKPNKLLSEEYLSKTILGKIKGNILLEDQTPVKFAGILLNQTQYDYIVDELKEANQKDTLQLQKILSKKDKDVYIIVGGKIIKTLDECDPGVFYDSEKFSEVVENS